MLREIKLKVAELVRVSVGFQINFSWLSIFCLFLQVWLLSDKICGSLRSTRMPRYCERYKEAIVASCLQGAYDLVESKRRAHELSIYACRCQVSGWWQRRCVLRAFRKERGYQEKGREGRLCQEGGTWNEPSKTDRI